MGFNHPNPRGLGLYKLNSTPIHHSFNHPNPRGLGHNINCKYQMYNCFNHPNPRGLGHNINCKYQMYNCFNHPNPRGLGRQKCANTVSFVCNHLYMLYSIIPMMFHNIHVICHLAPYNLVRILRLFMFTSYSHLIIHKIPTKIK